jgi:valyl-tRNA synthetase
MDKHFEFKTAQAKWNQVWEQRGIFAPERDDAKPPFVVILPPPNVTGVLHVGHVLGDTVQDHLIRWKRMCGYNTLWLPGTDHAGIATQKVVEDALLERGLKRAEMTRERFLEHAWEWKDEKHDVIVEQLRNLGCALDWSREAFTLDEPRSRAVREVFVKLYEKGLIYQGDYIVNWCPSCQTAISDEEVEYRERDSHLWWIEYPTDDGGHLVVATTRPETMLGDTGIAVSPDDEKNQNMIGRAATLPIVGRRLPIVGDEAVDKEFGSGFVKVTPAHDPNDFDIAQRQGLPAVVVIDRRGRMTAEAGQPFEGLDRFECRKKVVEQLQKEGLLQKIEPYKHSVGHHDRCGTVIEPLLSREWFVRMRPLADPAIGVVERNEVTFYPERWRNVYMSWMTNIKDWCISRQLWWGHRIPVWYCAEGHVTVSRSDPTECGTCGSRDIRQDENVLDTWFSSWLWTFSPMGWPDDTEDLRRFHPTQVLVTGYEIIFFWVARMMMASLEFLGEIPFSDVFLTGIVRDSKGRKMSKSLGNSPDPLDIIDRYGTDAFRFTLSMLSPPGKDVHFDEGKVEMGRNFVNKIWQASRMVMTAVENNSGTRLFDRSEQAGDQAGDRAGDSAGFTGLWAARYGCRLAFEPRLTWEDRWILGAVNRCAADVDASFTTWRLNEGTSRIYEFFWHEFCDWYIELAKNRLYGDGDKRTVLAVLLHVLAESVKLIHPLMPYVTEEIWDILPMTDGLLLENPYPSEYPGLADGAAQRQMEAFQSIVTAARNIRAQYNGPPGASIALRVRTPADQVGELEETADGIRQLARVDELQIGPEVAKEKGSAATPIGRLEVVVPLAGVVDLDAETSRLKSEKDKIEVELAKVVAKLGNEKFVTRAKPEVVQKEREKKARLESERDKLVESIAIIKTD